MEQLIWKPEQRVMQLFLSGRYSVNNKLNGKYCQFDLIPDLRYANDT